MKNQGLNLKGLALNRFDNGIPKEMWLEEGVSFLTREPKLHPYAIDIYQAIEYAINEGIIVLDVEQSVITEGTDIEITGTGTALDPYIINSTFAITAEEIKILYESNADTNAFTDVQVTKLDGIEAEAEVNVQSDWGQATSSEDSFILNKPTIPTTASEIANVPSGNLIATTLQTAVDELQTEIDALVAGGGIGDMVKAVYDTNDSSVVDDSENLEGNDSAYHLDRGNHTGTQLLTTISDSGTAAALDVPSSGDASVTEVVKGDDTRLDDNRDPNAHTHNSAEITDFDVAVNNHAAVTLNTVKLTANAVNVDNAGAVMNADTSTGSMDFVLDEDDLGSDSPTKLATQQSIKAYVDNQFAVSSGAHTKQKTGKAQYFAKPASTTYSLTDGVGLFTIAEFGDLNSATIIVDRADDSDSDNFTLIFDHSDNTVNTWQPDANGSVDHDLYIPQYQIFNALTTRTPLFYQALSDKTTDGTVGIVPEVVFGNGQVQLVFADDNAAWTATQRIVIQVNFIKL